MAIVAARGRRRGGRRGRRAPPGRAVRRFVAARLAGQPGALPPGYVADAAVGSDGEKVGAVVLLDEGRPPAAGAQAVLRLAAVAALTLAALRRRRRPTGRGRRAPCSRTCAALRVEPEALVARARRLGVDLAGGRRRPACGGARRRTARAPPPRCSDVAPGGLVLRRGDEVDALLAGERAGAEERARADRRAPVGARRRRLLRARAVAGAPARRAARGRRGARARARGRGVAGRMPRPAPGSCSCAWRSPTRPPCGACATRASAPRWPTTPTTAPTSSAPSAPTWRTAPT